MRIASPAAQPSQFSGTKQRLQQKPDASPVQFGSDPSAFLNFNEFVDTVKVAVPIASAILLGGFGFHRWAQGYTAKMTAKFQEAQKPIEQEIDDQPTDADKARRIKEGHETLLQNPDPDVDGASFISSRLPNWTMTASRPI